MSLDLNLNITLSQGEENVPSYDKINNFRFVDLLAK